MAYINYTYIETLENKKPNGDGWELWGKNNEKYVWRRDVDKYGYLYF